MFRPARQFVEKLIPYVHPPKYPKPGEWAFFATTCRECPAGCGMLMYHRDGRVTKAEGNPLHPINRGKLCIRGQSSVQGQYDPERLRQVQIKAEDGTFRESSWEEAMISIRQSLQGNKKAAVISDLQTGSLARAMKDFTFRHGRQEPLMYEAFNYESIRKANQELYGQDLIPRYQVKNSDLIISFSADFLETWLSPVEYARAFGAFHSLKKNKIGKYIYIGASETLSAANADRFIPSEPGEEAGILYAIASRLQQRGGIKNSHYIDQIPQASTNALDDQTIDALAQRIMEAKSPLILAGSPVDASPRATEAVKAAALLNELLGNQDKIDFSQYHALSGAASKKEVHEWLSGLTNQDILIIHNTNPVYSEPGTEKHIRQAGKVIYIGTMMNETAKLADVVLPANYPLEEWGDFEPWRGTLSLMQPTMGTVYDTRSAGEIFMALAGKTASYKDRVRSYWQDWALKNNGALKRGKKLLSADQTPEFYDKALQSACIRASFTPDRPGLKGDALQKPSSPKKLTANQFHFMLYPSLSLYDGKLANRSWLQEIPHPLSNIVWQSWVDMNKQQAREMGIRDGEVLKLSAGQHTLQVPVRLTDHMDPRTIAMVAGQGHTALGKNAAQTGVNGFLLLASNEQANRVEVEKTGRIETPVYLQPTTEQQERGLLKQVDLEKLTNGTAHKEKINWPLPKGYDKKHDMYEPHEHKDHRWAMVIDLQKCIGCKACEAACYAENNIITLGKKNLEEGREMSWLKVTNYSLEGGHRGFLPLPCQHCDSAPCEPVCPVFASVHTEEGLNAQIYNRCIGTRYCSNNCPYKVRRFNWVRHTHEFPTNLQLNPEVTVRDHGVMEKCTFCVQRIVSVRQKAKIENRPIRDQEIQPACVQTCPTDAIVFGDLHDKDSRVNKLIEDTRRYQLLAELNTKPAVIYLKKIRIKT